MPSWSLFILNISPVQFQVLQAILSVKTLGMFLKVRTGNEKTKASWRLALGNKGICDRMIGHCMGQAFITLIAIIASLISPQNILPIYLISTAILTLSDYSLKMHPNIGHILHEGVDMLVSPILWHNIFGIRIITVCIVNNIMSIGKYCFLALKHFQLYFNHEGSQETFIKALQSNTNGNDMPILCKFLFQPLGQLILMIHDACISAMNKYLNMHLAHSISHSHQAFMQAQGLCTTKSKETAADLPNRQDSSKEKIASLKKSIEWSQLILGPITNHDR